MNLMHGDCLELMREIPDGSVDMCLTDPPYGTTQCKWDTVIPFEPMWGQLKRIVKPNGAICLFGSEPFSSHLRLSNLKMFKYDWVWDKVTGVGQLVAKYRPLQRTEIISIFGRGRIEYYPVMELRDRPKKSKAHSPSALIKSKGNNPERLLTHKYPKNLLVQSKASRAKKDLLHPTQKPVPLLEYLIKTYTLEGETVLDFTMGSGSTGVAAANLGRQFIGIEQDNGYYDIAVQRIKGAQNERSST